MFANESIAWLVVRGGEEGARSAALLRQCEAESQGFARGPFGPRGLYRWPFQFAHQQAEGASLKCRR